ncbi:hypothetical protein GCM10011609_83820 [Lentzea pudingi]|uniref:Uncharacterized protein n=1 Tax=Lentzea pudingi TaxID=1789439 RepID=A0ABQ2IRD6_9PSEU|nr:hypothetical protein GCM10011609_83820 [Lentzea pudingi]
MLGEVPQRRRGAARDGEGQRHPAAQGRHPVRRLPVGRDPAGPRGRGEQRDGAVVPQRAEVEPVPAGQARQDVAAGHDHERTGTGGQQRPDLGLVRGVVEHSTDDAAAPPMHRTTTP